MATTSPRSTNESVSHRVPMVVQVGIAGSRHLIPEELTDPKKRKEFLDQVGAALTQELGSLRSRLKLREQHFFCALSQAAIGVDALAIEVTEALGWRHRIMLPRLPEEYFSAESSDGVPDFTDEERSACEPLLNKPHVIEVDVVSTAFDRDDRFTEVNHQMARICDVVIMVVSKGTTGGKGGTRDLEQRVERRQVPHLLLEVEGDLDSGVGLKTVRDELGGFDPPVAPHELDHANDAGQRLCQNDCSAEELRGCLSAVARDTADKLKDGYLSRVRRVLVAHAAATGLATLAILLARYGDGAEAKVVKQVVGWILGIEIVTLALGLWWHLKLHRDHDTAKWAMNRLVEQVVDSAHAMRELPTALRHYFVLPLPRSMRPLLRTLNVLHLEEVKQRPPGDPPVMEDYLRERIDRQIRYNEKTQRESQGELAWMNRLFIFFSALAIAMTSAKFLKTAGLLSVPSSMKDVFGDSCGFLAIWAPVVAAGALSWAIAGDLKGRAAVCGEMLGFLKRYRERNESIKDGPIFHRVALEAEERLLGESATWYARRAFID